MAIPRNTPIGTSVLLGTPDGSSLKGVIVGEVDFTNWTVAVAWEGYTQPRTEQLDNLNLDPSGLYPDPTLVPTADRVQSLSEWWEELAHSEIAPLIAKMDEYGGEGRALDLITIGRSLIDAGVVQPHWTDTPGESEDAYLSELGIYFYLQGKMARWSAAIASGRLVSDDTLHDIGIYVRMAQRIRAVGGWPV